VPVMTDYFIARAGESDLGDLLGLMRAYCDFYAVGPSDDDLLTIAGALIADPEGEGVQLLAREGAGQAAGFATVYWSWSTTSGCRIGVMNDLFVALGARGQGLAEQLIESCRAQCVQRGARRLTWQTAADNLRAQTVYERVGATRAQWIDYSLPC
jgi:GNAT superfamily N-acetyltransferase